MIKSFSQFVTRFRWAIVGFWLLSSAVIFLTAPALSDIADYSSQGFLPGEVGSKKAEQLLSQIAGAKMGETNLVITMSRDEGLQANDETRARKILEQIDLQKDSLGIVSLLHPWLGDQYKKVLIDETNHVALAIVGIKYKSYDKETPKIISQIRDLISQNQASLRVYVTGEAAFSTDEHLMVQKSMDLITLITVILVLTVLVFVFKSPFAPLLPLSVIGLSFLISRGLIAYIHGLGLPVSAYTETFLIAVLFGAGTDYCILLVSRYLDEIKLGHTSDEALRTAQHWSMGSILSSGAATLVGFSCMGLAVFGLYNSTGPAVAIGVAVAILMVLSLTPALLSIFGRLWFWPRKLGPQTQTQAQIEKRGVWPKIAAFIKKRPVLILILTIAFFLPSTLSSFFMTRSFDQVSEIPAEAGSRAGFETIKKYFDQGLIMPIKLVITTDKDVWGLKAIPALDDLAQKLGSLDAVKMIRSATRPNGIRLDRQPGSNIAPSDQNAPLVIPKLVIGTNPELKAVMETFIAEDGKSTYFDIILKNPPYEVANLDLVETLRTEAQKALAGTWLEGAKIDVGGPTAMFADVRSLTDRDFTVMMVIVLVAVFLVLVMLLRSIIAPFYLLLTILISFVSTMGLSTIVFQGIFGYEGVNWAVQFFSFCVLVALGVDYNIFLMARVKEEKIHFDTKTAIERALVGTGKIITTCGIIMAGCFSAMMVSPIRSIQEVGFTIVTGLLLDTFIIRSFMVPSIATLLGEANWWPQIGRRKGGP